MGKLFITTTLILAAVNGALGAVVVGAVLATGSYFVFKGSLGSTASKIYDAAEESIQRQVDAEPDPELKRAIKQTAERRLKEIRKRRDTDNFGADETARMVALGVFAFPPAAIGVAAHMINKQLKN